MINHPNRSKATRTTWTVYDTQDSSWFRDGLSEPEARELFIERNRENSRYGDRYAMVTDAEFEAAQINAAVQRAIDEGADEWQAPADWQPGDYDGCWDHPAAAEARRLTAEAGVTWEFTNWSDFLRSRS